MYRNREERKKQRVKGRGTGYVNISADKYRRVIIRSANMERGIRTSVSRMQIERPRARARAHGLLIKPIKLFQINERVLSREDVYVRTPGVTFIHP